MAISKAIRLAPFRLQTREPEWSGLWVRPCKPREGVTDHWNTLGSLAFLSLFQYMCMLKMSFIFINWNSPVIYDLSVLITSLLCPAFTRFIFHHIPLNFIFFSSFTPSLPLAYPFFSLSQFSLSLLSFIPLTILLSRDNVMARPIPPLLFFLLLPIASNFPGQASQTQHSILTSCTLEESTLTRA